MYPREIIFGMTLYDILMGVGVIVAMLIFRYFSVLPTDADILYRFLLSLWKVHSVISLFLET